MFLLIIQNSYKIFSYVKENSLSYRTECNKSKISSIRNAINNPTRKEIFSRNGKRRNFFDISNIFFHRCNLSSTNILTSIFHIFLHRPYWLIPPFPAFRMEASMWFFFQTRKANKQSSYFLNKLTRPEYVSANLFNALKNRINWLKKRKLGPQRSRVHQRTNSRSVSW